ncbi:MAG: hypothetical protein AAF609_18590 [Cyanobacteria bacterium P01_C01_bin.120]
MIPGLRIVLYQGQAKTIAIDFFEGSSDDDFPATGSITLTARLPGAGTDAFMVTCSRDATDTNKLLIPFTAGNLSASGNFNYEIWENDGTNPALLKLKGLIALGQGIEVVPTFGAP